MNLRKERSRTGVAEDCLACAMTRAAEDWSGRGLVGPNEKSNRGPERASIAAVEDWSDPTKGPTEYKSGRGLERPNERTD